MNASDKYEIVIGLEVHTQVTTQTKIFCACGTKFGVEPNTQVCPVCLGFPGVLPVLNKKVIEQGIKTCLMFGFEINHHNQFARKNYFYPDLPKGYQISQFDLPIGINGKVRIYPNGNEKLIRIHRVHMEEDAGKSMHASHGSSVDFNRTGVPLLEIVSEPDIRSSEEAVLYLKKIKQSLLYAGISDCNMEEGSLRCDANVSIRPKGSQFLGTKTEIKNVNSFRYIQKAIDFEVERQIQVVEEGGKIVQETRLYDSSKGVTRPMRSKEEAHDYRYFPDPDLVPVEISTEMIEAVKKNLPEHPDAKLERFMSQYGLPLYDAEVLTQELRVADFFETCMKKLTNAKLASNWIMSELMREWNQRGEDPASSTIALDCFVDLIQLIDSGKISGKIAKDVLPLMFETKKNPKTIVEEKGWFVIDNTQEIKQWVQEVLSENEASVNDFKNGKDKAFGFLVGQLMKKSKGKADPKVVNELLREALS